MFSKLDNLESFRQDSTMKNEIDFQMTAAETVLLNIGTAFLMALGMINAFAFATIIQKVF